MRTVGTERLNEIMVFTQPVRVDHFGHARIVDLLVPESVYQTLDENGHCTDNVVYGLSDEWTLLDGYSGQYGYSGPVMHRSELIGGRMALDILSTPGIYVALEVVGNTDNWPDTEPIGWVVARRDETIMLNLSEWTRLDEVDSYAARFGIDRAAAIQQLVNHGLNNCLCSRANDPDHQPASF